MRKNRFIVITGPTASGKTFVSVEIAKRLDCEIICADSMQIYKDCDIGTAKAAPDERQGVPHHMLDVVLPGEEYSVAQFQSAAFLLIDSLNSRGITPIVSGGTGLYINSLTYCLDFGNEKSSEALRQKYSQLADDKSLPFLYNILKEKDPEYASIISPNDKRRIIRRLEILDAGIDSKYDFRKYNEAYDYIIAGLTMPRETLYHRIDKRVDDMMDAGLLEEARRIYETYGCVGALKAIGYKELVSYINGEYGIDEAVRLIKRNTRRFAKRQHTWFKRDERITWFDVSKYSCIEDTINDIIIYIKGKGF